MALQQIESDVELRHQTGQTRLGAASGVILGLALLMVLTVLALLRQRGVGALDTLWAEDGTIFLQGALRDGSPRAWLDSYAGYLHLVPRMLASLAAILPLDWAPIVLSGGAALAAAGLTLVVYRASESLVPPRGLRAVLALGLLASPSAGLEVTNAAANIHWYMPFAVCCVAFWRPKRRAEMALGSVLLFLTAASDPFGLLVGPVLAWRLVKDRRASDVAFAVALGAGAILQVLVILGSSGSRPLDPLATPLPTLAKWYGFHVLETATFGIALRDLLVNALGVGLSAVLAVGILGYLLIPAARAARPAFLVPAILTGLHLAFFFLPVALAGTSPPRYAITPILLLYMLIVWGVATQTRRSAARAGLALVLLAVITVVDFAPWNPRAEGPPWSEELSRVREACSLASPSLVRTRVPPRNLPAADERGLDGYWTVEVSCASLASD